LLDEIARGDDATRQAYTDGVLVVIDGLAARMAPEDPPSARVKALSLLGLMAGTLQLSRALTDRQLSDDLLEQGLRNALALVDAELRPMTDTSADKPAHPATSPSRQENDD
jgi:TetR/AcrR family transcriptional regulator, transcriptional repressor for nem operon